MALISCPECSREISDQAVACPHCGRPATVRQIFGGPDSSKATRTAKLGDRLLQAIGNGLAWVFGVVLTLGGLVLAAIPDYSIRTGILAALAGLVLLPYTSRLFLQKFKLHISTKFRVITAIGLALTSQVSGAVDLTNAQVEAALAFETAQANALKAQFDTASTAVLEEMRSSINNADYQAAIEIAEPYRVIGHAQLDSLYDLAVTGYRSQMNRDSEQELIALVRQIPASDIEENRRIYGRLMTLNPTEPSYRERYRHYNNQIKAREQEAADRVQRFGEPPRRSAWNGTYGEVREYLTQVMNDPASLDMDACTDVYHVSTGWLVGCDYRGRNAFGGMIRQSNWFIIRNGIVVDMKDADAYRP